MKLTDAMAMGKLVLTTRVGDIPEIIGDCGYMVAPSNPDQLAEALDTILKDPRQALERGRLARERFISCYGLKAVGAVLSDVIQALE